MVQNINQLFTLNPDVFTDLILNPCVGVTWVMSSDESCLRIVVLPALSRPKIRMNHYDIQLNATSMVQLVYIDKLIYIT